MQHIGWGSQTHPNLRADSVVIVGFPFVSALIMDRIHKIFSGFTGLHKGFGRFTWSYSGMGTGIQMPRMVTFGIHQGFDLPNAV